MSSCGRRHRGAPVTSAGAQRSKATHWAFCQPIRYGRKKERKKERKKARKQASQQIYFLPFFPSRTISKNSSFIGFVEITGKIEQPAVFVLKLWLAQ